jgi:hypothetical protein
MTDIEIGSSITTRKAKQIEIDGELVVSTGVPIPGGLTEYDHHFTKQYDKAHSEDYTVSEAIKTLSKARIAYDPKEEGAYRYQIVDHVESLGYKSPSIPPYGTQGQSFNFAYSKMMRLRKTMQSGPPGLPSTLGNITPKAD